MATTFKLIQTITVGVSGAANIEFTSIPATYTDLALLYSVRANNSSNVQMSLAINSTSANYADRVIEGTGTSVATYSNLGGTTTGIYAGALVGSTQTANTFNSGRIYLTNYAGSSNKPVEIDYVTENNTTLSYQDIASGLWSNSAAITALKLTPSSGSFVQYSSASLYGIIKE